MKVTFDSAKADANVAKHGVSLSEAADFEWGTAMVWPDTRRDYGEARMVALGYIGLRIMALVFVDRPPEQPTERRVISLRKANSREVRRYAET
nr:BrnT family toxin [uncultured Acidovorax sp.]